MELLNWLTATTQGKFVFTMLVSMIPIVELRGGLPFGVAMGLPYYLAFPAAVVGNLIPSPFIIVYIRRVFLLLRKYFPRMNGLIDRMETKAHLKGQKVRRYQTLGLWLFVAIPLPGTGAWTGSWASGAAVSDLGSGCSSAWAFLASCWAFSAALRSFLLINS